MLVGDRIRALREALELSQRDITNRCGLQPAYVSRIENGHTVPSVETLEKFARALEVPIYALLIEDAAVSSGPRSPADRETIKMTDPKKLPSGVRIRFRYRSMSGEDVDLDFTPK